MPTNQQVNSICPTNQQVPNLFEFTNPVSWLPETITNCSYTVGVERDIQLTFRFNSNKCTYFILSTNHSLLKMCIISYRFQGILSTI